MIKAEREILFSEINLLKISLSKKTLKHSSLSRSINWSSLRAITAIRVINLIRSTVFSCRAICINKIRRIKIIIRFIGVCRVPTSTRVGRAGRVSRVSSIIRVTVAIRVSRVSRASCAHNFERVVQYYREYI